MPKVVKKTMSSVNSNPAIGLTEEQLSEEARTLGECALADYKKGGEKWFLRTDGARLKILTEIVARQADAAIGEHYIGDENSNTR
jgi:hypothetical protein